MGAVGDDKCQYGSSGHLPEDTVLGVEVLQVLAQGDEELAAQHAALLPWVDRSGQLRMYMRTA